MEKYLDDQNESLYHYFHQIKKILIAEFNQYQPLLLERVRKKMKQTNFVASQELPELLNQES